MNTDSIHEAQENVAKLQATLDDAQRMLQAATTEGPEVEKVDGSARPSSGAYFTIVG